MAERPDSPTHTTVSVPIVQDATQWANPIIYQQVIPSNVTATQNQNVVVNPIPYGGYYCPLCVCCYDVYKYCCDGFAICPCFRYKDCYNCPVICKCCGYNCYAKICEGCCRRCELPMYKPKKAVCGRDCDDCYNLFICFCFGWMCCRLSE